MFPYCVLPEQQCKHRNSFSFFQMLLRPQSFDLRQWHFALEKLPRTSEVAAADHEKTGMVLNQVAGVRR